ncbi:hypothetical protein U5N28_13815 [Lysinibacillus telephonicus]
MISRKYKQKDRIKTPLFFVGDKGLVEEEFPLSVILEQLYD